MSLKSQGRVKEIKSKIGDSFSTPYPIGTDALYVDVLSKLDLEEQLKLGGPHCVSIITSPSNTKIREWYFTQSKGTQSIDDMIGDPTITFSVQTIIPQSQDYFISYTENPDDLIVTQDGDYLIQEYDADSAGYITIDITLFRGDMRINSPIILHHKQITIEELEGGNFSIDQQIISDHDDEGGQSQNSNLVGSAIVGTATVGSDGQSQDSNLVDSAITGTATAG